MLDYALSKNHSGVTLIGDYLTLRGLYDVIHDVNENSPIIRDKEGSFLGLAYDVRHAFMGDRRIIKPPKHEKEIGVRYGVDIIWPVILVQCRMLRAGLGYFDNAKIHQSFAFALESLIEDALRQDFGNLNAPVLIELWQRIDPASPCPEERLVSRCAMFCSWRKKERYDKLAGLLASFDPMYEFLFQRWSVSDEKVVDIYNRHFTRKNLVSPEEYAALDGVEWPEFEW